MRILHTSDWHLGRIFHGLHLTNDQAQVLEQLTQIIKDEKIDAIAIAGDIYDRGVPPTEAVELLDATFSRWVQDYTLPIIAIAGNHDNAQRLSFGQQLFAANKLFIYGQPTAHLKPLILEDQYGPVYFAPLTYCEPLMARILSEDATISSHEAATAWQVQQITQHIPANARQIALAHVFLTGSDPEGSERPLAIGGSTTVSKEVFSPFTYTALGHLHGCQTSGEHIRYSGSLMKYSFNEATQRKGVHIIDLDDSNMPTITTITLTQPHDLVCLKGKFQDLIEHPELTAQQAYTQITLTDTTPILDAKNRLEAVYPYIMELAYTRLEPQEGIVASSNRLKLTTQDLFTSFFTAVEQRELTPEETTYLHTTLNEATRAKEEE